MLSLLYRYDSSNDNEIDPKELAAIFSAMVKFRLYYSNERTFVFCFKYDLFGETDRSGDRDPKKRAEYVISKLDVNGDRKLNKQEFIAGYILFNYIFLSILYLFLFVRCKNDDVIRKMLVPNA
jgi:hypothetical protein